jgi:hypothetical protein
LPQVTGLLSHQSPGGFFALVTDAQSLFQSVAGEAEYSSEIIISFLYIKQQARQTGILESCCFEQMKVIQSLVNSQSSNIQ